MLPCTARVLCGSDSDGKMPAALADSPMALPASPMVHVMSTDNISMDGHPAAPGLTDANVRSDGYVRTASKNATGSSARPDEKGELRNAIQVREMARLDGAGVT